MLYRTIAYSTAEGPMNRGERVVFIDAGNLEGAKHKLRSMLSALWEIPSDQVDWYNLNSEQELVAAAMGSQDTGDWRLLEIGCSLGHAAYIGGLDQPLFLLDESLDRLQCAYLTLPHRGETGLRAALGKF